MLTDWIFKEFQPGAGETAGAWRPGYDDGAWDRINVPGDIHKALMEIGRIPDPFYDRHESECAWMETQEWWYRTTFSGPSGVASPDERVELVFHGLDTYATIWLNGTKIGSHQNMFREAVYDVTELIAYDDRNVLAVRFDPPLERIPANPSFHSWGRNTERIFMRKAQFGYGWDWGPRLPTIGIWRPVELRRYRTAALRGIHFYTLSIHPEENQAWIGIRVEVEPFREKTLYAVVRLEDEDGSPVIEHRQLLDGLPTLQSHSMVLTVDNPRLWWTHDLGDPHRYHLTVNLMDENRVLDTWKRRVGIRHLVLDQTPDPKEPGTRFFRFILNGVSLFAKGANWIPADSFVGAMTHDHYRYLLQRGREAHMNMIRIWGGGIYEHDVFYDLCDELGILVWQDFMFACAIYPDHDPVFIEEVDREARYQIRRLRYHPCMALWCGNNENQWIHDKEHWDVPGTPVPGALLYDRVLPEAVSDLDGQTPYWPGSPYGGNDHNSMEDGDRHNWHVWHGDQPRRFGEKPQMDRSPSGVAYWHYGTDNGRFISEFGMHASPVLETLRRCIPQDQLYHHSDAMDHHNKDEPKNKGDHLMATVTGIPSTLEDYIDFSMIAQAEGLKYGVEHFRRRKPHCSGSLIWQLNDCWPGLSWSVMDYYGFGKAGYYALKRAYHPVLASFKQTPSGGVQLWVTNDTLRTIEDTAKIQIHSFTGEIDRQEDISFQVPAESSQIIWEADLSSHRNSPDHVLWVRSSRARFPDNRLFFTAIKSLRLQSTEPEWKVMDSEPEGMTLRFTAKRFVFFIHIDATDPAIRYSDNYFDLVGGNPVDITVTHPDRPVDLSELTVHWR
jgi:beta-mannosidase